jgi:tRNA(Ile)-lysidine synthase TilS/MesJ
VVETILLRIGRSDRGPNLLGGAASNVFENDGIEPTARDFEEFVGALVVASALDFAGDGSCFGFESKLYGVSS